jgi:hypothetical protein
MPQYSPYVKGFRERLRRAAPVTIDTYDLDKIERGMFADPDDPHWVNSDTLLTLDVEPWVTITYEILWPDTVSL